MTSLRLGPLMAVACAIASVSSAAQEVVHFPSLDDQHPTLDGYLYRPEGAGRHPAIIGLHGCSGMFVRNSVSPNEFAWAYQFRSRG